MFCKASNKMSAISKLWHRLDVGVATVTRLNEMAIRRDGPSDPKERERVVPDPRPSVLSENPIKWVTAIRG